VDGEAPPLDLHRCCPHANLRYLARLMLEYTRSAKRSL
jgi:hypothetical protein